MTAPPNTAEHPDDGGLFFRGLLIGLAISIPIWGVILSALLRALPFFGG
jgi:hypothetical protein